MRPIRFRGQPPAGCNGRCHQRLRAIASPRCESPLPLSSTRGRNPDHVTDVSCPSPPAHTMVPTLCSKWARRCRAGCPSPPLLAMWPDPLPTSGYSSPQRVSASGAIERTVALSARTSVSGRSSGLAVLPAPDHGPKPLTVRAGRCARPEAHSRAAARARWTYAERSQHQARSDVVWLKHLPAEQKCRPPTG